MTRPLFFALLLLLLVAAVAATTTPLAAESRPGPTLVPPADTPTETATPTPTSTPAPRGPLLESILSEDWWLPTTNPLSVTVAAAWQAVCAGSLADSYADLSGHGHDLTTGVDPAWSAAGWTFAGGSYLITDITHDATNLHSVIVDVHVTAAQSANAIGLQTTATLLRLYLNFYGTFYYSYAATSQPSATAGAGIYGGNAVVAMTTDAIYVDGAWRKNISAAGPASGEYISIGSDGTERFYGIIRSIAIYEGSLTATQVGEISDNMAALPAECAPTPTPTATATATPSPTATSTNTPSPTATATATPSPAPLTNYIELPSGGVAALSYHIDAGEAIIAALAAAAAVLLLYEQLRSLAHERAK